MARDDESERSLTPTLRLPSAQGTEVCLRCYWQRENVLIPSYLYPSCQGVTRSVSGTASLDGSAIPSGGSAHGEPRLDDGGRHTKVSAKPFSRTTAYKRSL